MNAKIRPICNVVVCFLVLMLTVLGLARASTGLLIAAMIVAGLAAVGLSFAKFSATRTPTSLLLGAMALWLVLGRWILSLIAGTREGAEAWSTYGAIVIALLLVLATLAATRGAPSEEPSGDSAGLANRADG